MSLLGRKWPTPIGMLDVSVDVRKLLLTWYAAQPMWPFYVAGKPLSYTIHSVEEPTTIDVDFSALWVDRMDGLVA